jgi:hypothetical protein
MPQNFLKLLGDVRKKRGDKQQINVVMLDIPSELRQAARNQSYGINLGAGANGVVEPWKPVALDMGTRPASVLHEDETYMPSTGEVRPSPATMRQFAPNLITPSTEEGQANLQRMQDVKGLPGFQVGRPALTGGFKPLPMPPNSGMLTDPARQMPVRYMPVPQNQTKPAPTFNIGSPTTTTTFEETQVVGALPTMQKTGMYDITPMPKAVRPAPTVAAPDMYKTGAEEGYANTRDVARGQSEYSAMRRDRELTSQDASTAALRSKQYQTLLSEGRSPSEISSLMSQFDRSAGMTRADLAGTLAMDEANSAESASRDMFNFGMQGRQQDLREKEYDLNRQKWEAEAGTSQSGQRISELFTRPGTSIDAIKGDQLLRQAVADRLGVGVNDAKVDAEIDGMVSGYLTSNRAAFQDEAKRIIENMRNMGASKDEIYSDESLRWNVALSAGLSDPKDSRINNALDAIYSDQTAPLPVKAVDAWVRTYGIPDEYKDQETSVKADLVNIVSDLVRNGDASIDSSGAITVNEGAEFLMPWNDPATMFKYLDWNGNDVEYDQYGNLPSDYQSRTVNQDDGTAYTKADGNNVTYADMQSKWDSLNERDQFKYIDNDGTFLKDKFIKDKFGLASSGSGNGATQSGPAVFTADDFRDNVIGDSDYAEAVDMLWQSYTPTGTYKNGPNKDQIVNDTDFVYYDENGIQKTVKKDEFLAQYVLGQIAKNNDLDIKDEQDRQEVLRRYGDGAAYRVSTDGNVLNYTQEYVDKYGLTEGGNWEIQRTIQLKTVSFPKSVNISLPSADLTSGSQLNFNPSGLQRNAYARVTYNDTVYNETVGQLTFKDDFKSWVNENAGNSFDYNGKTYVIPEDENPIVWLTKSSTVAGSAWNGTQTASGEVLRVYDTSTNQYVYLNFGSQMQAQSSPYDN